MLRNWYARSMYVEGSPDYKYQLAHYGRQSRFGYKDLCAQWTLLNWEPDDLISRYKKAGAKIFLALALAASPTGLSSSSSSASSSSSSGTLISKWA